MSVKLLAISFWVEHPYAGSNHGIHEPADTNEHKSELQGYAIKLETNIQLWMLVNLKDLPHVQGLWSGRNK
jgi:hypothetical protein